MSDASNTGNTGTGNSGTGNTSSGGGTGGGSTAPWYGNIENAETRGYVEQKGFKDVGSLVESYRNLEKFHGVPPDQILKLPKDLNDQKELGTIYDRLGRPKTHDEYEIDVPTGASDDFAQWAKEMFHGVGLNKTQAKTLAGKWNERVAQITAKNQETDQNEVNQQTTKLKEAWGAAFDQNLKSAKSVAAATGMTEEQASAMSQVLGVDGFFKLMHGMVEKFGIKLKDEGTFGGSGGSGGNGDSRILSPEAATARIKELIADQAWSKRYLEGDTAAKIEMENLHKWELGFK